MRVHLMMNPWPPDDGSDARYETETADAGPAVPADRADHLPGPDLSLTCPLCATTLYPTTDGHAFCPACRYWQDSTSWGVSPEDAAGAGHAGDLSRLATPADSVIIQGIWGPATRGETR